MLYHFFKRLFDIVFSLFVLIFFSPFLVVVSLIVFLQDGGSIIFKQKRIGIREKGFIFYKFRSMPTSTPNVTSTKKNQIQITPFGKFIRRTNIDELPQFINVLKKEMSIVGPRP